MVTIITNAFSINMLPRMRRDVHFRPLALEEAGEFSEGAESAVGHRDTAHLLSEQLGCEVAYNPITIELVQHETRLLVGQYRGPRLPEGTTTLPEGASIEWWLVV